ncbi:MAG: ATP-binding protein [Labedaea sp.]
MSLARQLLVLQVIIVTLLVAGGAVFVYLDVAGHTEEAAREKVTSVASTVADAPTVLEAVAGADPTARLQPLAEDVRADTGVDFVTIMNPSGRRWTHPNPVMIGGQFLGHTEQALAGDVFTETYTGTLGPSVRAVVPVFDAAHTVVALVSVGITVRAISGQVRDRLVPLLVAAVIALLVGCTGTYLVSRRIGRQTHGLAPAELGRRIDYHEAILHAVREGLLLVDKAGRVTLCNDGARTLLDLSGDIDGRRVAELGLPQPLAGSLSGVAQDEIRLTDTRVLVVNSAPVRSGGGTQGTVVTLRDHTDLQALTGELNSVRGFAESLRSQAHEAANRLHTVVSLVELGRSREAVEFATSELEVAQRLTDRVVGAVAEPVLAALLLGKAAEASERGVALVITDDTEIDDAVLGGNGAAVAPRDVVTILGNLIDNALDAALEAGGRPQVFVTARTDGGDLVLRVADTGPGLDPERAEDAFHRGWSTKNGAGRLGRGIGLALVGQAVRRNRGTVEIGTDGGAVFTVRLPVRA